MARWNDFVMFSTSFSFPFLILWLVRTESCYTTRPAPMFKWPTSLLPIRPLGRPTAREEASNSVYPCAVLDPSRANSSMVGVSAARMACIREGRGRERRGERGRGVLDEGNGCLGRKPLFTSLCGPSVSL